MKKTLYQNRNKKLSIVLFVVLTPLMALKSGSQSSNSDLPERIVTRRANEVIRKEVDRINDTIRFIDAWQRYKDSSDKARNQDSTNIPDKK